MQGQLLRHAVLLVVCSSIAVAGGDELQADDWLVGWAGEVQPVVLDVAKGGSSDGGSSSSWQLLTLSNGLVSRRFVADAATGAFATIALDRAGHAGAQAAGADMRMLRAASPEGNISLDGFVYPVGGLRVNNRTTKTWKPGVNSPGWSNTDFATLNETQLPGMTADTQGFLYKSHRLAGAPAARYAWTPGVRHSNPRAAWPPRGLVLEIDFVAPSSARRRHRGVTITVHYEMYAGLPAFSKWLTVKNEHAAARGDVAITSLTMEVLHVTQEAMLHGWASDFQDAIRSNTPNSVTGRVHMESEMSRGGPTTTLVQDDRCTTCVAQGNMRLLLKSGYSLGRQSPSPGPGIGGATDPRGRAGSPGAQIGPTGFHGTYFTTFRTYTLLHDSDDLERQGLAVRRMYRVLAPQVTETPTYMDVMPPPTLNYTSFEMGPEVAAAIRRAVDECVEVGFEGIILANDHILDPWIDMISTNATYIAEVKAVVDYAHSRGIEVGAYWLLATLRNSESNQQFPGLNASDGNCLNAGGGWNLGVCMASGWADEYFRRLTHFIDEVGLDMITTDGPFEARDCYSHNHSHHRGVNDSQWTQYEANMRFYAHLKEKGVYINSPDPYYMRGSSKDDMGYSEGIWDLTLWEQIILARQNIYDGTWVGSHKPLSLDDHLGEPRSLTAPLLCCDRR